MRVVGTIVLLFWLAGPLAGGGCLRECPDPAAAASADACHTSAPGAMFAGTHDCGTHFAPARDLMAGTARKDLTPAPALFVAALEHVAASGVAEPQTRADSSPPTRFLTPLRQ